MSTLASSSSTIARIAGRALPWLAIAGPACTEPRLAVSAIGEHSPVADAAPTVEGGPHAATTPAAVRAKASSDPAHRAALERGRTAFRAKNYTAAVAAFEDAVALEPGDPEASCELGWAALHAGRLDEAETALAIAIDGARGDRQIAGAAWYNLGRLREAQQRPADAIAAYETSLVLRPSAIVQHRVDELRADAGHRPTLDVEQLAGPLSTLQSWCDDAASREHAPVDALRCNFALASRDGLDVDVPDLDDGEGVVEARFVTRAHEEGVDEIHLAVRTDKGWFVSASIGTDGIDDDAAIDLRVAHLGVESIELGGREAIVVRVHGSTRNVGADGRVEADEVDERRICGLGRKGRPSITSPIPLAGATIVDDGDDRIVVERWSMTLAIDDDAIVLGGSPTELDSHHRAWLGRHALAFR